MVIITNPQRTDLYDVCAGTASYVTEITIDDLDAGNERIPSLTPPSFADVWRDVQREYASAGFRFHLGDLDDPNIPANIRLHHVMKEMTPILITVADVIVEPVRHE